MPEFLRLVSPAEALARWMKALPEGRRTGVETIETPAALGRVLAEDIVAPHPLPPFPRSTVDGYAVRAEDTFGAGPSAPSYLHLVGEVPMGRISDLRVHVGEAALVHTGGAIPDGANAVVMLEDTQTVPGGEIEILTALGIGKNVIRLGEDIQAGEKVMETGQRLRPQEIGGLMAIGRVRVAVFHRPRVAILSTGDEVVPADAEPRPGQVRDVNSHTLAALVLRGGGEPVPFGILPDDLETLFQAAERAKASSDLVMITAGSSASARDVTAEVVRRLGSPGVLVHGLSIKPGKPAILGIADGVPVIGLPGNPVSALVVAGLLVTPMLRRLGGDNRPSITAAVPARLAVNVPSEAGREDYVPARLEGSPEGWIADPVFGKSNLIFTLVRADGLIRIPPDATGLSEGSRVDVIPFE
jgi:molybdopterin molybdotransferase